MTIPTLTSIQKATISVLSAHSPGLTNGEIRDRLESEQGLKVENSEDMYAILKSLRKMGLVESHERPHSTGKDSRSKRWQVTDRIASTGRGWYIDDEEAEIESQLQGGKRDQEVDPVAEPVEFPSALQEATSRLQKVVEEKESWREVVSNVSWLLDTLDIPGNDDLLARIKVGIDHAYEMKNLLVKLTQMDEA